MLSGVKLEFPYYFSTFLVVVFRQFGMLFCSSLLDNAFDRESAPLQNFAQRFYYAACLVKPDIEWPWGGAGAYDDCFLAFMQRLREPFRTFSHHAVHDAVDHYFLMSVHISPIAR